MYECTTCTTMYNLMKQDWTGEVGGGPTS